MTEAVVEQLREKEREREREREKHLVQLNRSPTRATW